MKIKNKKLISGVLGALAVVLGGGLSVGRVAAWGPERQTYTMANPAESATFNSITDNAAVGDERDFVRVVKVGTGGKYSNEVTLEDGGEYEVYIYYHNDASSTFNTKEYNYRGVASKTKLSTSFPINVKNGAREAVSAIISSTTTTPEKVWDEAYFKAEEGKEFNLAYKEGSAKIYNDWGANGKVLSIDLFSEGGTYLGLNELNGLILGCDQYSGQVVYRLIATEVKTETPEPEPEPEPEQPEKPEFYIEKKVSKDGGITWEDEVEVSPGAKLEFRLTFKNIGKVTVEKTFAFDTLELGAGMEYVFGSTKVKIKGGELEAVEDGLFENGINLGKFEAGESAEIYYQVKVKDESAFECGDTTLFNGAAISFGTENGKGSEGGETSESGMATLYDKVMIKVKKACGAGEEEELPNTGPAEVILAIIVVLGIGAGMLYYLSSRKTLKKIEKSVKGKTSD